MLRVAARASCKCLIIKVIKVLDIASLFHRMKTMNGLFHRDVLMPPALVAQACKRFALTFSGHAKVACRTDRYGVIIPPTSINPQAAQLIEVEAVKDVVVKAVIRIPHDSTRDLIIVYVPDGETAMVKTLWFNLNSDKHYTLDKSRYVAKL